MLDCRRSAPVIHRFDLCVLFAKCAAVRLAKAPTVGNKARINNLPFTRLEPFSSSCKSNSTNSFDAIVLTESFFEQPIVLASGTRPSALIEESAKGL